jgi:hypothetical protein
MYSPKIREDLIPEIYKLSKQECKTMTRVVDEILREGIEKRTDQSCPPENPTVIDRAKKTAGEGANDNGAV